MNEFKSLTSLVKDAADIGIALARSGSGARSRLIPTDGPADLVTLQIHAGKARIPLIPTLEVVGLSVTKEANRIAAARLVLLDGDPSQEAFPVSRRPELRPGNEVEVLAGYHSRNEAIFKGVIVRQRMEANSRGMSQLILDCKHPVYTLTQSRHNRCFIEKTDSEVLKALLKGRSVSVTGTSLRHEKLIQFNASDWDFILSRADANGLLVLVEDSKIVVTAPALNQKPVLSLTYGANILEMEIQQEDALITEASDVQASSWDPKEQKVLHSSSGGTSRLQHGGDRTQQELKDWAEAASIKSSLANIRGRVRIQGYAKVGPGHLVELNGIGKDLDGTLFVSGVQHQINNGDWTTDIQIGMALDWYHERYPVAAPPAGGLVPPVAGLQIGVVSQIANDPREEFRVQVKLPFAESQDTTVWARIARLDAGTHRGTLFLPEVDDEVVLGFLSGDPRDAIILGMLHSSQKKAPLEITEKNELKGIVSREQLRLVFDDETKGIELSTPEGNAVFLSEDEKKISIADQNGNRFEMTADGISVEAQGNKIELTSKGLVLKSAADLSLQGTGTTKIEGANIDLSAQGQLKAAGNAGIEVSSSGIAVLKGSLIKIN